MKTRTRSHGVVAGLSLSLVLFVVIPGLVVRGAAQPAPMYGAPSLSGRTLTHVATIDLPGPSGKRFDYLTIDDEGRYLFSAHLAAGLMYVIDVRDNTVVKTIADVPGIEGIAYIAQGRKVYTSNWYENKVGVVDLRQMKVVKRIPTEEKPDGIAYAAPFRKAYVSDERAKAVAVIDTRDDRVITTLHFESETGVPQYDRVARKVYVNLQDQNVLAIIDPARTLWSAGIPSQAVKGTTEWRSTRTGVARFSPANGTTSWLSSTLIRTKPSPIFRWRRMLTSSSSIPAWGGSTWLAAAERSQSFRWTRRINSARSRMFPYLRRFTAWSWT